MLASALVEAMSLHPGPDRRTVLQLSASAAKAGAAQANAASITAALAVNFMVPPLDELSGHSAASSRSKAAARSVRV